MNLRMGQDASPRIYCGAALVSAFFGVS